MTRFDRAGSSAGPSRAPSGAPSPGVRWPAPEEPSYDGWGNPNAARPSPPAPGPREQVPPPRSSDAGWDDRRPDGHGAERLGADRSGYASDPGALEAAYGRPAWFAILVMVAITAIGVVIDVVRDATGGVNIAIIVAALVAILIVRRLAMFPVVIAPPLVYILGSAAVLYLRSGGPHNKTVLIDIATNWLVYGFPAMAAASVVVLAVAAVRMVLKR